MNRRELLIGAAAVPLASSVPAFAEPAPLLFKGSVGTFEGIRIIPCPDLGYAYSKDMSDMIRHALMPHSRFRQFIDPALADTANQA